MIVVIVWISIVTCVAPPSVSACPHFNISLFFFISQTGTLFWLRDIKEYQEVVRQLHIPAVNEMFETMRSIANLFMVPPDALVPTCTILFCVLFFFAHDRSFLSVFNTSQSPFCALITSFLFFPGGLSHPPELSDTKRLAVGQNQNDRLA